MCATSTKDSQGLLETAVKHEVVTPGVGERQVVGKTCESFVQDIRSSFGGEPAHALDVLPRLNVAASLVASVRDGHTPSQQNCAHNERTRPKRDCCVARRTASGREATTRRWGYYQHQYTLHTSQVSFRKSCSQSGSQLAHEEPATLQLR